MDPGLAAAAGTTLDAQYRPWPSRYRRGRWPGVTARTNPGLRACYATGGFLEWLPHNKVSFPETPRTAKGFLPNATAIYHPCTPSRPFRESDIPGQRGDASPITPDASLPHIAPAGFCAAAQRTHAGFAQLGVGWPPPINPSRHPITEQDRELVPERTSPDTRAA